MFFQIVGIALLWPLLQVAQPPASGVPEGGIELSIEWEEVAEIETGLNNLAVALICPFQRRMGGTLLAIDSSGAIEEYQFADGSWSQIRAFHAGEPVVSATTGPMEGVAGDWQLLVGTRSGRILEFSRRSPGWARQLVDSIPGPIHRMEALASTGSAKLFTLFVIDGVGDIVEYVKQQIGVWQAGPLPPTPGGATSFCFNRESSIFKVIAGGPAGTILVYQVGPDNKWHADTWAVLEAPPEDMAISSDPTRQDLAIYYSGADGAFRYLFHGRKTDEASRLPVANGARFIQGLGPQRRHGEFFATVGDTLCAFVYEPGLEEWQMKPLGAVNGDIVSYNWGAGRGKFLHQMYVATIDGRITEFSRANQEPIPWD